MSNQESFLKEALSFINKAIESLDLIGRANIQFSQEIELSNQTVATMMPFKGLLDKAEYNKQLRKRIDTAVLPMNNLAGNLRSAIPGVRDNIRLSMNAFIAMIAASESAQAKIALANSIISALTNLLKSINGTHSSIKDMKTACINISDVTPDLASSKMNLVASIDELLACLEDTINNILDTQRLCRETAAK